MTSAPAQSVVPQVDARSSDGGPTAPDGTWRCRLCGQLLTDVFVDLGMSPPCESYVPLERLESAEVFYPLRVWICSACLLVQLPPHIPAEDIFSDYAYFSSYSSSWVEHARVFTETAIDRLAVDSSSLV